MGCGRSPGGRACLCWCRAWGTVFNTAFTDQESASDYRSYVRCDLDKQKRFLHELQEEGVRPTSRGTWFLSTAHSDADIEETVRAAERALGALS